MMKTKKLNSVLMVVTLLSATHLNAEEAIDASDPTKIYTYAGGGVKYTDYTNDETMTEIRAIGNVALSDNDMLMFEFGYGWHDGNKVAGSNDALTNGRLRWFHLFDMDYSVVSGYRGLATQVDVQIAGELKGTDGQNVITIGVQPAFGINESWSFFLGLNVVNSWDKKFENYNGLGLNIAPLFVYAADWWEGSYVQIWPGYTYFIDGELKKEGSANLDITMGGAITDGVMWALTYQKNYDIDLLSFRRGADTGATNDQNIFLNITTYF